MTSDFQSKFNISDDSDSPIKTLDICRSDYCQFCFHLSASELCVVSLKKRKQLNIWKKKQLYRKAIITNKTKIINLLENK